MSDELIMVGKDSPLHCLVFNDSELQKITLIAIGEKGFLIQKMREISEVLFMGGELVKEDMSRALSGYPTINHTHYSLQVIHYQDYLSGEEACASTNFNATGAHLKEEG